MALIQYPDTPVLAGIFLLITAAYTLTTTPVIDHGSHPVS